VTSSVHPRPLADTSTGSAPSAPEPQLLDHEYDGIREYDNPLPGWWVWMFWGSFFFSIGYIVHYHLTGNGKSVAATYEDDVRAAREERAKESLKEAPTEAVLGRLMADKDLMLDARVTFGERCAVCHGAAGQGLIGPNLTDESCLHGDHSLMATYEVVSNGVPTKGMPAWALQLKPIELRKLVAYVGTLRGTNVSGKAPEGAPCAKR
jgi:cytochrome c oxidase cbb3-type subunit III